MADLVIGDCRDALRQWAAEGVRVQTVVTSPPYWGLRDYGTATWEGGEAGCDHFKLAGGTAAQGLGKSLAAMTANVERSSVPYRDVCGKCGARRIDQQLGLEPTPEEYVVRMVEVFALVREVLAEDGTVWLNLGDSYASQGGPQVGQTKQHTGSGYHGGNRNLPSLKPKDLVGIPWRVAFALQADGWYLRSDIIWAKPNPMPESVTDRPTKAHEYLFLLAKSERYYFDAEAIREHAEYGFSPSTGNDWQQANGSASRDPGRGRRTVTPGDGGTRNRRTVWTIATQPFPEAHFATFPEDLVKPCILAGSRPGDIVLDPFMGSGTVAKVAQDLGRRWLGCELNPTYAAMVTRRAGQLGLALL